MGLKTSKSKKAAKQARKRAEQRSEEIGERAAEAVERAANTAQELAERAATAAQELAENVRDSDAYAKASTYGKDWAKTARSRWDDSHLDERAADLAERLREAETTQEALKRARKGTDQGMAAIGGWLASGPMADKLGVKPRRRWPMALAVTIGAVVGFALAKAAGRASTTEIRDELADAANRLASRGGAATVMVDTIRSTLDADPRTAQLGPLDINISEGGTVFVRGVIPVDVDEQAVRDVIASVPGVVDVDLQLTPASAQS